MARFDKFMAEQNEPPKTNGHATSTEHSSDSTPYTEPQSPPTPKKQKHDSDEEASPKPKKKLKIEHDSDAAFAARLQAMENSRARSTRGGGPKIIKPVKKKSPKKKSAGRIKAEDDSDLEGSGSEVKERKVNRNSGFHVSYSVALFTLLLNLPQKELMLSAPLSALLDNETKVGLPLHSFNHWPVSPQRKHPVLTTTLSSHAPKQSRESGNTSARTTCRTPRTNA